jgi:hypothetical protein
MFSIMMGPCRSPSMPQVSAPRAGGEQGRRLLGNASHSAPVDCSQDSRLRKQSDDESLPTTDYVADPKRRSTERHCVATVAIQSARHAARTIVRPVNGDTKPRRFRYRDFGTRALLRAQARWVIAT